MKINKKGFFLIETIAVLGITTIVLVTLYAQISNSYQNYSRNATYNTVESIHATRTIKSYIEKVGKGPVIASLQASGVPILDITSYTFDATTYYGALLSDLNVKKVYLSNYDINSVVTNYTTYNIDAKFLDFLRTLKVVDTKNVYRIIIVLYNEEYSSIIVNAI